MGSRRRTARRRLGRRGQIAVLCALALSGLLVGGWFWFRDSPLTSASHVTVVGASGPDAARIQDALESTAHTMSTLEVDTSKLRGAVAPYPIVKDIDVTARFPHEMRIHVVEQLAVAAIDAGSRKTAVAADGTLLHDVVVSRSLPLVPMRVPPGGARVTDSTALGAIRLLAAAPARLRAKVTQVTTVSGHGLVAQLQTGPAVYFGDTSDLRAKWLAAAAVLADAGSTGAAYIDVTDPRRPAAGSGPSATADQSATGSTTATGQDSAGAHGAADSTSVSPSGG